MSLKQKLVVALIAYAALAMLVWKTLDDDKLRYTTWIVLAFFALRTLLIWRQRSSEER